MAATNSQKVPLARSLNDFARVRSGNAIQQIGKAWPCSVVSVTGSIVTVKFEVSQSPYTFPQVAMPVFGPEYIRYPIQAGDKGMAIPADAYLGQMTDMGTGGADLSRRGNLSQLVFMPVGNAKWSAADANAVTIYGPNGAVLRTTDGTVSLVLTPSGVTIKIGSVDVKVESSGVTVDGNLLVNGNIHATGTITP